MFKKWTMRRSREKTWKPERKTTKDLVSGLSFYVENIFGRCDGTLGINQYSILLISEIIPYEESTHLS
jgi:hypothetical protein